MNVSTAIAILLGFPSAAAGNQDDTARRAQPGPPAAGDTAPRARAGILLLAAPAREMDGDVGGNLDRLRQAPHDPAVYLLLVRGRQFKVSRDGRQMPDVVASTHRQAPLDHGLLTSANHSDRRSSVPGHCMSCPGGVPSGDGTSSLAKNGARAARTASSTAGSASRTGPPNEANTPPGSSSAAMRGHRPSGFVQCSAAAA